MTAGRGPEFRENELLRALGGQAAPRPVSWLMVGAVLLAGTSILVLLVSGLGSMRRRVVAELEPPVDAALLKAAVGAYERADWDEAERQFRAIRERFPGNARSQDYLDRIELTRRDAELLARAEEALVAGQSTQAKELSERVAPNSRLYAQAEALARSARAHEGGSTEEIAAGEALPQSVRAVLGEALALYEDGEFVEAVQRADVLALRAAGPTRGALVRWARDVTTFAALHSALPTEDAALLESLTEAQTAIDLDERLSDGHYARMLRVRAARALIGRAAALGQSGRLMDACGELVRAQAFAGRPLTLREGANPALERRCEGEAARRVSQARMLERRRAPKPSAHKAEKPSPEAQALFEQARAISLPGSPAHLAAEQAIGNGR